jgi:hypothetical protein
MAVCKEEEPEFLDTGSGHFVACWLYEAVPSQYADQEQVAAVS